MQTLCALVVVKYELSNKVDVVVEDKSILGVVRDGGLCSGNPNRMAARLRDASFEAFASFHPFAGNVVCADPVINNILCAPIMCPT